GVHRSRRISFGPDADEKGSLHSESLILNLIQRQKQFCARGLFEAGVLDVSNNANHRTPGIPKVRSYAATNGTLVAPKRARHRLVDNRNVERSWPIPILNQPPLHEPNSESLEVVLRNKLVEINIL